MDGILPVWKPAGMSSFDVIRRLKREYLKQLPEKVKIGHAGTLDPFADGVLLIMLGRATKRFDEIMTWGKTYQATARLGAYSDTLDNTGNIKIIPIKMLPENKIIDETASKFTGKIEQAIPDYSAAKFQGKPRYLYARQGIDLPVKTKPITINSLKILNTKQFDDSNHRTVYEVELEVACSSGTYIRQLSYDIFKSLDIESYLVKLTRTWVGKIGKEQCITLEDFQNAAKVLDSLIQ